MVASGNDRCECGWPEGVWDGLSKSIVHPMLDNSFEFVVTGMSAKDFLELSDGSKLRSVIKSSVLVTLDDPVKVESIFRQ